MVKKLAVAAIAFWAVFGIAGVGTASADPACAAIGDNMGDQWEDTCEDLKRKCQGGDAVACLLLLIP